MAECHPVAFRWPMKAKLRGAQLIHVDPRFTRTSAMADHYAPVRAGTDIAFLGGLIRYVLESPRWNREPFFREYVTHYTNAATLVREDYQGPEELEGVFSGLMQYTGGVQEWPFNGFLGTYRRETWQYARQEVRQDPRGGPAEATPADRRTVGAPDRRTFDEIIRSLRQPAVLRDETLQHPRCVFQILKRHYARYTPEMVERVTGCPRDTFVKVAESWNAIANVRLSASDPNSSRT